MLLVLINPIGTCTKENAHFRIPKKDLAKPVKENGWIKGDCSVLVAIIPATIGNRKTLPLKTLQTSPKKSILKMMSEIN